jgi:hypothetical protein
MFVRSTKQTRSWSKLAALKHNLTEKTLREDLAKAQLESERNPDDATLYAIWRDKEAAVTSLEENKAKWITEKSKRYNIQAGKLGYKHVYTSFKKLAKETEIVGLEDEDGTVYTNWEDMERITVKYFEIFFISEDVAEETDIKEVLDKLNLRLTDEDQEFLNAVFTGEELLEALKGLGKNKAPGPDGVPGQFYLAFWKEIEETLVETLNEGMLKGEYSKDFL